jgi:hypothetical protein
LLTKGADPHRGEQATAGGASASPSRPPGTLGAYVALVLAVLVVDAVDGGLSSDALGGAAVLVVLVLGVLSRLRSVWMALIVLQCGNVALLCSRGEWGLVAANLVLLALLVARPTRNYVLRREDPAKTR